MDKKYIKQLDEDYKLWLKDPGFENISKIDFVGVFVFDITTDDSGEGSALRILTKDVLEVCKVILDRTNFDYIDDDKNYLKYMTVINFSFFKDKLECGTSIRGAWFEYFPQGKIEIDCSRIVVERGEIEEFIRQLLEWINL